MKLSIILAGSILTLAAQSSFASNTDTTFEESRGALGGALVGAVVGGPIGAGAGAILGGAVIGKLWGSKRVGDEIRADLQSDNQSLQDEAVKLERYITELNQDIDTLLAKHNDFKGRQLPIQFTTASSEIEGHYETQLNDVARLLARNPDTNVVLSGFSDRRGDAAYNQTLSEQRVSEVKAYLLSHGAGQAQVITQAFGETQPVAEEGTTETFFFDRRVVMSFEVDMNSPLATR